MSDLFRSKILLFGEYTIIKGSRGLALPLEKFRGEFVTAGEKNILEPILRLDEFCDYLEGSSILSENLDLLSFSKDIKDGQYFHSNIPQGYGVGSSGALCAAVYAKYSKNFERKDFYNMNELKFLKDIMALMESFYHGASSGLDCLISLIDKPLLIESRNKISLIPLPSLNKHGGFYLYDSGKSRKTSSFVNHFLNSYDSDLEYKKEIDNLVETTNSLIDSFSHKGTDKFIKDFKAYSEKQLSLFEKMIPGNIKDKWLQGLNNKSFFFKLCGAGGGGFFLVFSPDTDLSPDNNFIKIS